MRSINRLNCAILLIAIVITPTTAIAQGTLADYERAQGLRTKYQAAAINLADRANWINQTNRFWYRKLVKGGSEFVLVDADTLAKTPAFDQERIATSLS